MFFPAFTYFFYVGRVDKPPDRHFGPYPCLPDSQRPHCASRHATAYGICDSPSHVRHHVHHACGTYVCFAVRSSLAFLRFVLS